MLPKPEQEEENWDDDFDFESSAGSPVQGARPRSGAHTPPNLSPGAADRHRNERLSKERNRKSDASLDWDDEDETINFRGFAAQHQQPPSTPKASRITPGAAHTPKRRSASSDSSEPPWDEEEEVTQPRYINDVGALQTITEGKLPMADRAHPNQAPQTPPRQGAAQLPADNATTPSKSEYTANESTTDASSVAMSDSSAVQQSDASVSASSSFFGRLGRRLSKATAPSFTHSTVASPTTETTSTSTSFTALSPAPSSNALSPKQSGPSPSRSRTNFIFGGNLLKRSESLSRASNSAVTSSTDAKPKKKQDPSDNIPNSYSGFGLGVHVPGVEGGSHTAPAEFNAQRYTERIVPPVPSTRLPSHASSRSMAPGWGRPPSPTRESRKGKHASIGGASMLTDLLPKNKGTTATAATAASHEGQDGSEGAPGFFSSMRKRSNPLQVASKVPQSAMVSPLPPSEPRKESSTNPLGEATKGEDKSGMTSYSQRPRRSHRRNISTGAMITSVIDEVSSDATISNKLTAFRNRSTAQRSSLNNSTTAQEFRPVTPPPRLSTSSGSGASLGAVSPIEFSRSSEDSVDTNKRTKSPVFAFPPSLKIRPVPYQVDRKDAPESPTARSSTAALLPPIELKASPPKEGGLGVSKHPREASTSSERIAKKLEPDNDLTPVAVPRRRIHHLHIGTGNTRPVPSQDTPKARVSNEEEPSALAASGSTVLSVSNSNSSKTLAPRSTVAANKQFESLNGRASPGISASLGRLAGSSTAEKLDDTQAGGARSSGVSRRNSLTGGTTRATLSSTTSGGGLKIPARIRQTQDALKRDLNAVREFALSIDEIKRLQLNYDMVLLDVKQLCGFDTSASDVGEMFKANTSTSASHRGPHPRQGVKNEDLSQPPTPSSPTFSHAISTERDRRIIAVPEVQPKTQTNEPTFIPLEQKEQAKTSLLELDAKFAIWWECADLLIELGGAAPPAVGGTPVKSPTMPALRRPTAGFGDAQATPRASPMQPVLAPEELSPLATYETHQPSLQSLAEPNAIGSLSKRRKSTGQQDLNARQVQLLKGMLNTPNPKELSSTFETQMSQEPTFSSLSPVISNPPSTIRTMDHPTTESADQNGPPLGDIGTTRSNEREKKRGRRVSALVGKLGVKEILAGLKWAKEKAMQRPKQAPAQPFSAPRDSMDAMQGDDVPQSDVEPVTSNSQVSLSQTGAISRDNLNATSTTHSTASPPSGGQPPSPYKRSRRRSLASIFKFGAGTQPRDRSMSRSQSRVDLTSPTFPNGDHGAQWYPGNASSHDIDSEWDCINSPSDVPGRNAFAHQSQSSNLDVASTVSDKRGRTAPVGIPISNRSRRGSRAGGDMSASQHAYSSASASVASLAGSSIYGSAASHQSLHESFGGRSYTDKSEDERRRLRKPPSKTPRRPPSAGGRRSRPSSSSGSAAQIMSPTPSTTMPAGLDRSYHTSRSVSGQSHVKVNGTSSMRAAGVPSSVSSGDLSQPKLALTPDNIVPLLIYAREVKHKIAECLIQLKSLESDLLLSIPGTGTELHDDSGAIEIAPQGSRW